MFTCDKRDGQLRRVIGGSIVIEGGLEQFTVDTATAEVASNGRPDTGTGIVVTVAVVGVNLFVDVGIDGRRGIRALSKKICKTLFVPSVFNLLL